MVYTEQFQQLAKAIMRAQRVPESIGILVKGNPEFISDEALMTVADGVAAAAIERLTKAHSGAATPAAEEGA